MLTINIDIISGFLGAGKTTFLKKIIPKMEGKIALIENEFGDIGVDGDLIHDDIPIREIYGGCICCSLAQDFKKTIEELALEHRPDHILIEPSGVGSLLDILKVCKKISKNPELDIRINHLITIIDVGTFEDYSENFGGFYLDQIQNAHIIFLSHFDKMDDKEVEKVIAKIRPHNQEAFILKDEWYSYPGEEIIEILNTINSHEMDIRENPVFMPANKVFSTFSVAHPRVLSVEDMDKIGNSLKDGTYGLVFRAKGILKLDTGKLVHFDYTPHHYHWEYMERCQETKVVFIGSHLRNEKIVEGFHQ